MNDAGHSNHENCAECGASRHDSWILHDVRHKSNYRLLCTHCLLASFRSNFCHHCFDVFLPLDFPSAPRASQRVLCLHCPSISHLSCLNPRPNSNPNSSAASDQFRCPVCADPEFRFFKVAVDEGGKRVLKREATRALITAARIAAETVRKGAATAIVKAEKRVEEAAVARKRAREALERVAYLSTKDKEKKGLCGIVGLLATGGRETRRSGNSPNLAATREVMMLGLSSWINIIIVSTMGSIMAWWMSIVWSLLKQWLQATPGPKKEINDDRGRRFSGAVEFWWVNDLWFMVVVEWMVL